MDVYTLDDLICSMLSLYPGKRKDIIKNARKAEEQAKRLELNRQEKLDYIEDYIRDCLD